MSTLKPRLPLWNLIMISFNKPTSNIDFYLMDLPQSLHGYSITELNSPLLINNRGHVQMATCGCPASVGPTGRCKHISALCYGFINCTHQSCTTSETQKWNQPIKRGLDVCAIDEFIKDEYGKEKYNNLWSVLRFTSE